MIVTVDVNPRDKRNKNCFGEIFEKKSKIVTKHKIKKIREIYEFYFKKMTLNSYKLGNMFIYKKHLFYFAIFWNDF